MPNPPNPTGASLVRQVICSLNGGYNGLDDNRRLGITELGDGTIAYTLTDNDGAVEEFVVTVTPADD